MLRRLKKGFIKLLCHCSLIEHDWLVNISNGEKTAHCSNCNEQWGPYEA